MGGRIHQRLIHTLAPRWARRLSRFRLGICHIALGLSLPSAAGQTETIMVHLETRTGGSLDGLVVDHTDHGIVVVHHRTPYVFAWNELEPGSAVAAKRDLLALTRGGPEFMTAADHFELGVFALARSRNAAAGAAFRQAKKLDPTYEDAVRRVLDEFRRNKTAPPQTLNPLENDTADIETEERTPPGLLERLDLELPAANGTDSEVVRVPDEIRTRVLAIYRSFGETVRQVISKSIVLVETEHFLIWTDWDKRDQPRLAQWCEAMYAALCRQFDLDPDDSVFLAKCPVFCFRAKARFRKFARKFDGYDGHNAMGYSRSIEKNGHVHLALLRVGRAEADFDRFASTLVHEGTHAFLHRLYTTRLIPHWVNEGYADLIAERVMTDRCPNAENAALLARQYARYDWPIRDLLHSTGPIAVHQYPIAYSVAAFLDELDAKRFAGFIRSLKDGRSLADALAANYDGMTLDQLETRWRAAIRARDVPDDRWQP